MQQDRNKSRRPQQFDPAEQRPAEGKAPQSLRLDAGPASLESGPPPDAGLSGADAGLLGRQCDVRKSQLGICGQQHPVSPADGAAAQ